MYKTTAILSISTLLVSAYALYKSTRMDAYQRHEYSFFLTEYEEKLGKNPGAWARVLAINAALGGPAPTWHWIAPVVSPRATFSDT